MPIDEKEKQRLYMKDYNFKPEIIQKRRNYYESNKPRLKEEMRKQSKIRLKERKLRVYNHYSNYDIKCNCCGEKHIEFLSIDHINNDGARFRHIQRKGLALCTWIIKNNFPSGFQILCYNCNCAKGHDSEHICIHQKELVNNL